MNKKILKHISPDLKIGPRVAIIGSSGKLEDSGLGEEIDSYDDVIRFNRAPTELYEEDVGSKTTIRVVNSHVFANVPVPNPFIRFIKSSILSLSLHLPAITIFLIYIIFIYFINN